MARDWRLRRNLPDAVLAALSGPSSTPRRTRAAQAIVNSFASNWILRIYQGNTPIIEATFSGPLVIDGGGNLQIAGVPTTVITATGIIGNGNLTATITEIPQVVGGRNGHLQPFASNSPWNLPFCSGVQWAPTNDYATQQYRAMEGTLDYAETGYTMSAYIGQSNHPLHSCYVTRGDPSRSGTVQFRAPSNITPSPGTDKHLSIFNDNTIHEFWLVDPNGTNQWVGGSYTPAPLLGSGFDYGRGLGSGSTAWMIPGMLGWGSARAYGGSSTGGTVRAGELANGIQHMLCGAGNRNRLTSPWVYPATRDDGASAYPNGGAGDAVAAVRLGMIFGFPSSVNLASLVNPSTYPREYNILRALQTHGIIINDRGGTNWSMYHNYPDRAEAAGLNVGLVQSVISAHIRRATNITESTPKGGGTPLYPTVPEISSGGSNPSGEPLFELFTSSVGASGSGAAIQISADTSGVSNLTISGKISFPDAF